MMILSEFLFGFDLTNILIASVTLIVIYLAWKSTNVIEDRLAPTAVLIIENYRRNTADRIVIATDVERSSTQQENNYNATEVVDTDQNNSTSLLEDLEIPEPPPSLQSIIDEVNDIATARQRNSVDTYRALESLEENINELLEESEPGPERIIEDMDNPDTAEGLRRRRLAFYTQDISLRELRSNAADIAHRREGLNFQAAGDSTDNSAHAENCSNENNENENISKAESSKLHHEDVSSLSDQLTRIPDTDSKTLQFRIKLKYLNDELRMVTGSPSEPIGDFKKRNFTVELRAQKLVRLVFNGHVLQPDSKTLQACGLFDNCVVHCLIHNKKPSSSDNVRTSQSDRQSQSETDGVRIDASTHAGSANNFRSTTFLDQHTNGPMLIYLGIAAVSLAIVFCWYCRVQYSYLFSWYSTMGLVLMTALFLVMLPLIILIEREVTT